MEFANFSSFRLLYMQCTVRRFLLCDKSSTLIWLYEQSRFSSDKFLLRFIELIWLFEQLSLLSEKIPPRSIELIWLFEQSRFLSDKFLLRSIKPIWLFEQTKYLRLGNFFVSIDFILLSPQLKI